MGFRPEHFSFFDATEIRSKLFIHTAGLVELFGEGEEGIRQARQYGIEAVRAVEKSLYVTMNTCGVTGIIWGDTDANQRVCDVVGYSS